MLLSFWTPEQVTLSLAAKAFANSLPLCKETFFSSTMDEGEVQRSVGKHFLSYCFVFNLWKARYTRSKPFMKAHPRPIHASHIKCQKHLKWLPRIECGERHSMGPLTLITSLRNFLEKHVEGTLTSKWHNHRVADSEGFWIGWLE